MKKNPNDHELEKNGAPGKTREQRRRWADAGKKLWVVDALPRPPLAEACDILCFSHLRWDFVYQRPQHLLSRFARRQRVFYIEEPQVEQGQAPRLTVRMSQEGVRVVVPHLPGGLTEKATIDAQEKLLRGLFSQEGIRHHILWFYTPMALPLAKSINPLAVVYDCMDELSAFKGAPPAMLEREADLFHWANLVFTGGESLYEAKRARHPNVHCFPSSIDRDHFARARALLPAPADQAAIPGPRLGFHGVIDERMDLALVDRAAALRPYWNFIFLGPVVKIDPASLPRRPNIHYLGMKKYDELPTYLSGWDVALLPFALNESTRFISPTKTPEYLAAGKPVVSTAIRDVVRPYGERGIVRIANTPEAFVDAAEAAMARTPANQTMKRAADMFLNAMSWDTTWQAMAGLLQSAVAARADLLRRVDARRDPLDRQHERRKLSVAQGAHHSGWPSFHERRQKEA